MRVAKSWGAAILIGMVTLSPAPASASTQQISLVASPESMPVLNELGQVVWTAREGTIANVYFWDGTQARKLPGSTGGSRPSINNSGHIVWEMQNPAPGPATQIAFWNGSITTLLLDDSANPALGDYQASINDADQAVWEHWDGSYYQIDLWNGSTVQQLTHDAAEHTNPEINQSGQIIWLHSKGSIYQVCLWDGSTLRVLSDDSTDCRDAHINQAGQVVWQGVAGGHQKIFLWSHSSVQVLSPVPGYDGEPRINSSGQVAWIGGSSDNSGNTLGFDVYFWDGSSVRQLSSDHAASESVSLNDAGHVVWSGLYGNILLWDGNTTRVLPNPIQSYGQYPRIKNVGQVAWVGGPVFLYTPTPPTAPSGLRASVLSGTEAVLNWTDGSDDETAFAVWRQADGGLFTRVGVLPPNTTSFKDSGLTPNGRYTYEVRATNDVGASEWSNQITVVPANGPPNAPTGLAATVASPTAVALSWVDSSSNETAFAIWRQSGGGAFARVGVAAPNVTAFVDRGLTPDVAYTYKVRATNDVGASSWSNQITVSPSSAAPFAPSALSATCLSPTQIRLTWTDNSGNETAFAVWRQTGSAGFGRIGVLPANSTSFTDTGLVPGSSYVYQVRATNDVGASPWSNSAAMTLPN